MIRIKRVFFLLLLMSQALFITAQNRIFLTLKGQIVDHQNQKPIPFATVYLGDSSYGAYSDAQGTFEFSKLPSNTQRLVIRCMGYETLDTTLVISRKTHLIELKRHSFRIQEVQVNGIEKEKGSATEIQRMAIDHIQASSFTDILQLLPGNLQKDENLSSPNLISLREAAYDNNSSLGTAFYINGAAQSNDASFLSSKSINIKGSTVNAGIDMRNISTDQIESVEVIKGVPSAQYGDLTEGAIIIHEKRGTTPFSARLKANPNSKLLSLQKGLRLSSSWTWNIGGEFIQSNNDPRSTLNGFQRVGVKNKWTQKRSTSNSSNTFHIDLSTVRSIDKERVDLEVMEGKGDFEKKQFTNILFSVGNNKKFKDKVWKELSWSINTDYKNNHLRRQKEIIGSATPISPSTQEGSVEGSYLPARYSSYLEIDDQPLYLQGKINLALEHTVGQSKHLWSVGSEYNYNKNIGDGEKYDLNRPPHVAKSRNYTVAYPRAFKDIPAYQHISFFAEDQFSFSLFGLKTKHSLGMRVTKPLGMDSKHLLSDKIVWSPRWNGNITLWKGKIENTPTIFKINGGIGMVSKLPTMSQLYANDLYFQHQTLNFYTQNPETRRVQVWNKRIDPNNYQLDVSTNLKTEVGIDIHIGKTRWKATAFYEKNTNSFSSFSTTHFEEVTIYIPGSIPNPEALTTKPSLDDFAQMVAPANYLISSYNNNKEKIKKGIEWSVLLGKINALKTTVQFNGAWFKTEYYNRNPKYNSHTVSFNSLYEQNYYGILYGFENSIYKMLNCNVFLNTHLPKVGMIFTTRIGTRVYNTSQKLFHDGIPETYIGYDGVERPYTEQEEQDVKLRNLIEHYNSNTFKERRVPWETHIHLRLTKEIGKNLQCSFYANRIFNIEKDYISTTGVKVSRYSTPSFGAELKYKF